MLDYYIEKEQENQVQGAINAFEDSLNQAEPPRELYSGGWFDGYIGDKPLHPELWEYWEGYSQGNREYWCKQKGITLPEEF